MVLNPPKFRYKRRGVKGGEEGVDYEKEGSNIKISKLNSIAYVNYGRNQMSFVNFFVSKSSDRFESNIISMKSVLAKKLKLQI